MADKADKYFGGSMALLSFAGAYAQGEAARSQGNYQATLAELNSGVQNKNAAAALKRGDESAKAFRNKTNQLIGSQRAGFGAQGIVMDDGSAAEIQKEAQELSAIDIMNIRNNAAQEAWGFRTQATNMQAQGQFAKQAGDSAANLGLLTGGMQAADAYMRYGVRGK